MNLKVPSAIKEMAILIMILCAPIVPLEAKGGDTHRQAAEELIRAYEVKSYEERGRDLAATLVSGGYALQENIDRLSTKLGELLESDQFIDMTAQAYMNHFSEEEMVSITESLKNPAMRKFISIRSEIMQDMMFRIGELFDKFGITEELFGQ